jgi:hypothetical protein
MEAAVSESVSAEPKAPLPAAWFGLSRRTSGGGWERCEREDWGPLSRWWRVGELSPVVVAREGFGPGAYRVIWRQEDRRKHVGYSEPFAVMAENGALPKIPEPVEPVATPAIPEPAPNAPLPHALAGLAPLLGHDPTGPMASWALLKQIHAQDVHAMEQARQREHERMMRLMDLAIEQERSRASVAIADLQARHELANTGHLRLVQELATVRDERQQMAQAPLLQQLEAFNTRLLQLTESAQDDEDEDDDGALARIGEDPSDKDKVLRGIQGIAETLATFSQTPMGQALARRWLGHEGASQAIGTHPTVADDDAAE